MKLDEWIQIKQAIVVAIETKCGYIKNPQSGNWQRPRKDNIMMSVVQLNKIPDDLNSIPVLFINTEDPKADPSDRDINTILARTKHVIRGAVREYEEAKEQVIEPELIKETNEKPKTKPHKQKRNVPAKVEKPQLPAKTEDWRKGRTDAELAKEIEEEEKKRSKNNTKKALRGGKFYKPGGIDPVPTAKAIQEIANEPGVKISSEIREYEQTDKYAKVKVRSYLDDQYVESAVYLDFENEKRLKIIQLLRKHPSILDRFENGVPIIKDDAMILIKDEKVFAALHMCDLMWTYIKFSLRSATTTATTNNYKKLLNREWRSKEEIQMEQDERDLVQNSIETDKEMGGK